MSNRFYTSDYTGEMVSANTSWRDRHNPNSMTWVEKTIFNEDHPRIAHVIGNSKSRSRFNLALLKGQTGGADGVRSVGQSYGCNALFKDFSPTFLICTVPSICKDIAESNYGDDNIVYSNVKNIMSYPGQFHLYPKLFTANAGTLALRLACADGHTKIFMIGMTGYATDDDNVYIGQHDAYRNANKDRANEKFVAENCKVILTYTDVKFYYVVKDLGLMPEPYRWCPNIEEINYNQYIGLGMLGAIAH